MNKMWHNHTKEYYWAIKKKKVAIYATAWMNLENTTLSKRNETQKCTTSFCLCEMSVTGRCIRTEITQGSEC